MKNYPAVESEVVKAYADVTNPDFEAASKIRNLNFRASSFVSRDEAKRILRKWVPYYNEFDYAHLDKFPKYAKILICREYSVGLYVEKVEGDKLPSAEAVLADYARPANCSGVECMYYWWD